MANEKCIGCNKLRGTKHHHACVTRPGGKAVRIEDCVVPKKMADEAAFNSLTLSVHGHGMETMQETICGLLGPVMAEAQSRFEADHATNHGVDLFDDLEKVHTPDEEEYIQTALERCAKWLGDDMPMTWDALLKFGKKQIEVRGESAMVN